jgi:hypothetical protein
MSLYECFSARRWAFGVLSPAFWSSENRTAPAVHLNQPTSYCRAPAAVVPSTNISALRYEQRRNERAAPLP